MKLSNIGEVNDFLSTVNRCNGAVWLQDNEGSNINLKSTLSQYVAIAALISSNGSNLKLVCDDKQDEAKFHLLFSDYPNMA